MRTAATFFLLGIICCLPLPAAGQVVLDLDPAIDLTKIDLDLWNRTVVPIHDRLSRPYPRTTLTIRMGVRSWGSCGDIWLLPVYPRERSNLFDPIYQAITHEYGRAKQCPMTWKVLFGGLAEFISEGEAMAVAFATYRELAGADSSLPFVTASLIGKSLNNLPVLAASGTSDFYDSVGFNYNGAAFTLEQPLARMPGRDFSSFFPKLAGAPNTLTQGRYLQALDESAAGKIDGRLPSTNLLRSPHTLAGSPDGTYFAVLAFSILNPLPANIAMEAEHYLARSVINPSKVRFIHFRRSIGVVQPLPLSGLHYAFVNPDGRRLERTWTLPGSSPAIDMPLSSSEATQLATWPEGAYRLEGCILNGSACDPQQSEFAYAIVYHQPEAHNKMFLITTGPDYSELQPETNITLTLPPGATVEHYPNLIVINGTEGDVLATDGVRNRVFTLNGGTSIVNHFVDRFQPYLYTLTNAASFNAEGATSSANTVVPGSIVSLFSWGATDRDPEQALGFNAQGKLPAELCKEGIERTKVIFIRPDGSEVEAPFFYCSQRQLNVQAPFELRGSTQATVAIDFNGKRSNAVRVTVATADPGIFKIFDSRGFGAITHLDGALVDGQRPAVAGETLSLYATGLGAVAPEFVESGKPAPLGPLYNTVTTPGITIAGSQCAVSFSGLAPGYVGLYQVNFAVPSGLSSGPQKLTLQAGGTASNTVNLYVH